MRLAVALVLAFVLTAQDDAPPDDVVQAAFDAASANLSVPTDNLVIPSWMPTDWPDSSLGCPEPGHAYAQVVTHGYLLVIDTDDGTGEVQVHTDAGSRAVIC